MTIKYLGLDEVLRIHHELIVDYGGRHGVRDEGRLRSVVETPLQEVFGQQQYVTVFEKAAVYLRNIVGDHPFVDGNKRTGITVCGIFLARNLRSLKANPTELENFTISVVTDRLGMAGIAEWLQARCR